MKFYRRIINTLVLCMLAFFIAFHLFVREGSWYVNSLNIIKMNFWLFIFFFLFIFVIILSIDAFMEEFLSDKHLIPKIPSILGYVLVIIFAILAKDRWCYLGAMLLIAYNTKIISEPLLDFLIQLFGRNPNPRPLTNDELEKKETAKVEEEKLSDKQELANEITLEEKQIIPQPESEIVTLNRLYLFNRGRVERYALRYINEQYKTKFVYGYKLETKQDSISPDGYYKEDHDVFFIEITLSQRDIIHSIITRCKKNMNKNINFFKRYYTDAIGHFYQAVLVDENFSSENEETLRKEYNNMIDTEFEEYEFKLIIIRSNELNL